MRAPQKRPEQSVEEMIARIMAKLRRMSPNNLRHWNNALDRFERESPGLYGQFEIAYKIENGNLVDMLTKITARSERPDRSTD